MLSDKHPSWLLQPSMPVGVYRKVPKFSDTQKLCCNLPKIQTKRPNLWVFPQKDVNGIANSEDPDQQSDLGLHCLPRHSRPKTKDQYGNVTFNRFT